MAKAMPKATERLSNIQHKKAIQKAGKNQPSRQPFLPIKLF
jgi:hypothetical protein